METVITEEKLYQQLVQKLKSETDNSPLHSQKVVEVSQQLDDFIVKYMKNCT